MALALGTTTLANPWALLELRAELDARFGQVRPPGWHVLQTAPVSLDALLDEICARLCHAP
jgi:hypothetical protein